MFFHFKEQYPELKMYWEKYLPFHQRREVPAKTILLAEGQKSQRYIYIEKGCVRVYFNKNGEEKTFQFFFEKQGLTSFGSFINNTPSIFTIETIEPSVLLLLPKKYVNQLVGELCQEPELVTTMLQASANRQLHYINEFVSIIRDSPEERYLSLIKERPHIIQRVPQHYIASYLGVSKVHLSRIKSKLAKGKAHF